MNRSIHGGRVGVEQRMAGEVRVLLGGEPRRMQVLPERRVDSLGHPPGRRDAVALIGRSSRIQTRGEHRPGSGREFQPSDEAGVDLNAFVRPRIGQLDAVGRLVVDREIEPLGSGSRIEDHEDHVAVELTGVGEDVAGRVQAPGTRPAAAPCANSAD